MPCYDDREQYEQAHNNVAAQLLCQMLTSMPDELREELMADPNLKQWWEDHQHRDKMHERMAKERSRIIVP